MWNGNCEKFRLYLSNGTIYYEAIFIMNDHACIWFAQGSHKKKQLFTHKMCTSRLDKYSDIFLEISINCWDIFEALVYDTIYSIFSELYSIVAHISMNMLNSQRRWKKCQHLWFISIIWKKKSKAKHFQQKNFRFSNFW